MAHSGAAPVGRRERFRAVVYASMLPAVFTSFEVMESKLEAHRQCHTGDHMPDRELWHSSKTAPAAAVRPFYEQPPVLTQRQAELHGLRPYHAIVQHSGSTVAVGCPDQQQHALPLEAGRIHSTEM